MKNFIFLSLLSAFFLFGSFSNTSAQGVKIRVGVEAGPNIGGMSFPVFWRSDDFVLKAPGFMVGGATQIIFSKTFSIRTGLSFERKSFTYNDNFRDAPGAYGTRDFLIFPVMARWSTAKPTKYFFQIGLYSGYMLRYSFVDPNVSEERQNVTEFEPRIDIGLSMGMGLEFPAGDLGVISVEWRNSMGNTSRGQGTIENQIFLFSNSYAFSSGILLGFAWK